METLREAFNGFAKSFSEEIHVTIEEVESEIFYKHKPNDIIEVAEFAIDFFEIMFNTPSVQENLEMEEFEKYFKAVKLLQKHKPGQHTGIATLKEYYEKKFSQWI